MTAPAALRRLLAAAVLLTAAADHAVGAAGAGGAPAPGWQERFPADTDSVARDTTEEAREAAAAADTTEADTLAAGDTLGAADVAERREALGGGDFPERDSIFRRLQGLAGQRAVEYRGEDVALDLERETVELRGASQANYTAAALEADSISYRIGPQFISARGDIRLASEGAREVTSDSVLYYDVSRLKGTIMDARTAFAERGAEWYVRGSTVTPKGTGTAYVERGSFTSCELEDPHYHFRAGQIKVVSGDVIVAWPIVFYVHDVPIAWLPFFAQDIRQGRRSGFLPPRFGLNDIVRTSQGYQRSVQDFGYYLALNDFTDAQFTVDWFSGNYTRLNGSFRYRFLKRFMEGSLRTSYSFGETGRSLQLRGRHQQELSPRTDFRASINYVQDTRLFEDRSFDPRVQTQDVSSEVGFNHRWDFANLSLSGRRQQFLGAQAGRTNLTLPRLSLSFSPLTIHRSPIRGDGLFDEITLASLSLSYARQQTSREDGDDVTTTTGSFGPSVRFGDLTIGTTSNFRDVATTPVDSLGEDLPTEGQTTVNYGASTNYQLDLFGSTVLRPSVRYEGTAFRSEDTDGFVSAPGRLVVGASLSTDVYGFFPGFGPFTRIRHRISPQFNYDFSPETSPDPDLTDIPGFPAGAGRARNTLRVGLQQTFEAKMPLPRREAAPADTAGPGEEPGEEPEEADGPGPDTPEAEPPAAAEEEAARGAEEAPAAAEDPEEIAREAAEAAEEAVQPGQEAPTEDEAGLPPADTGQAFGDTTFARPERTDRTVVLLSLNTTPLEFDFAREGEPILVTDRFSNRVSSDLLRGLSFNITHDLFEGAGEERRFSPFLSQVSGSLTFSSTSGLGGIFGLSGAAPGPQPAPIDDVDSRGRLDDFDDPADFDDTAGQPAGPWTLSLSYGLQRTRETEGGSDNQSLNGNLNLRPTPNWTVHWSTQFDLTDREFGQHIVSLRRDLHRWQASFQFIKSPNGNVLFQLSVNLKDAPELRVDYDQRTRSR